MASTHQLKVQDIFSVKDYVCCTTSVFVGGVVLTFHQVCLVTGGGTGIGLMLVFIEMSLLTDFDIVRA